MISNKHLNPEGVPQSRSHLRNPFRVVSFFDLLPRVARSVGQPWAVLLNPCGVLSLRFTSIIQLPIYNCVVANDERWFQPMAGCCTSLCIHADFSARST